jgi:membrane-bound ClpP family serine protease
MKKIPVRLTLAILATLAEEIAIVLIVLLVLPRFGFHTPLPGLIGLVAGVSVYAVISYRQASRVLRKEPMAGFTTMVGSRGKVVSPLAPSGLIKIRNELWEATSAGRRIGSGKEIIVVGQAGLKLVVRKATAGDLKESK